MKTRFILRKTFSIKTRYIEYIYIHEVFILLLLNFQLSSELMSRDWNRTKLFLFVPPLPTGYTIVSFEFEFCRVHTHILYFQ